MTVTGCAWSGGNVLHLCSIRVFATRDQEFKVAMGGGCMGNASHRT